MSNIKYMKLYQFLAHIGFKKNEATVYLATLENGPISPPALARETDLPRTTVNFILRHLVERGAIGKTTNKKRILYVAESPDTLINNLKSLIKHGEELLPELEARYNKNERKPRIVFYEGKDAVQKVYDDTLLTRPAEILEWNTDEYFNFHKYKVDPHYIDKRVKLGIKAKRIAGEGSRWQTNHKRYDAGELSETKIAPKHIFSPEIEVNIYGNKVAFLNYTENMSVIIESKAIANAMRQAYQLSWLGAKDVEAKELNSVLT